MAVSAEPRARRSRDAPAGPENRRDVTALWRVAGTVSAVAVTVFLFSIYLRMSRVTGVNADGSSQALMGWDMLHGDVLLSGWTVSDVPFYTGEVPLLAVIEALHGLNAEVVHLCAAALYTMLTLGVAFLAWGRARGFEAVARVGVALAVMAVPVPGSSFQTLLDSPDHTGTSIGVLLALIVVDRWPRDRATAWVVGAVLAAGQISDPLVVVIGAVPMLFVCVTRLVRADLPGLPRPWRWRGLDVRLVIASVASIAVARLALGVLRWAGLRIPSVPAGIAPSTRWLHNAQLLVDCLNAVFGAFLHDRRPGLEHAAGVAHGVLLYATLAALAVVTVRWLLPNGARRVPLVDALLVAGAALNMAAFVGTVIPTDLSSSRQVAPVLFLGAPALGRLVGPRLAGWWATRRVPASPVATVVRRAAAVGLAIALTVLTVGDAANGLSRPVARPDGTDLAAFLVSHRLTYGIGFFWASNDITLETGGRVHVVPAAGADRLYAYAWLSRVDWYDPALHDARFVVSYAEPRPGNWTEADVRRQFGVPAQRYVVGNVVVLVYDQNLLVGLEATCAGVIHNSMADC
jgi:hypothetical protein